MRKMSSAIMAGALTMTLAVLAPSDATAQETFFVAPNGNVGIRTSTPNAAVHLFSSATSDVAFAAGPDAVAGPAFNIGYGGFSFGRGAGFLNVRPDASATAPNPSLRFSTVNQERMIITNLGNVGIGTASPTQKFHVFENLDANSYILVENPNLGISAAGLLRAKADTAVVSLAAHGSGRTLSRFGEVLGGWTEMLQFTGNGLILGTTFDKPLILGTNSTKRVHITGAGSIGIGTSVPSSLLHVSGGDVRVTGGSFIDDGVTLNTPDYVFEPGYDLMPLDELEAFIAREKRLPNVPSAREVKEQGLNLSQFQMRLLEKIEELALYTLALHEENTDLKARLAALENVLTPAPLLEP
jgi:hypothetical protein